MAQTTLIEATTAPATSTDLVVEGEAQITLYGSEVDSGGGLSRAKVSIEIKNPDGSYTAYTGVRQGRPFSPTAAYLTNLKRSIVVPSGTYRVVKATTTTDIGVFADDSVSA